MSQLNNTIEEDTQKGVSFKENFGQEVYDALGRKLIELAKADREREKIRQELLTPLFAIPEPEWLVEGMVVSEGISILYGDAGMGKTSLVLQLLGCLAERKPFLGLTTQPAKFLFISQDESPSLLTKHIQPMLDFYPSLQEIAVPNGTLQWDEKNGGFVDNLLDTLIWASEAKLVVIDSLTSLGIPDINQPKVAELFDRLRALNKKYQVSFLLLHHPNKGGDPMGSNLIRAKVDCLIYLKPTSKADGLKDGAEMELAFVKVRGTHPEKLKLVWSQATLTYEIDWHSIVALGIRQGKQRKDIVDGILRENPTLKREAVEKAVDRERKKQGK